MAEFKITGAVSGNSKRRVSIDLDGVLPFEDLMISTQTETLEDGPNGNTSKPFRTNRSKHQRKSQGFQGPQKYLSSQPSSSENEGTVKTLETPNALLTSNDGGLEHQLASEDDQKSELDSWDPMTELHNSTQNIKCVDAETTLKGIPHFRGTICPFSEGNGCFKGTRCPYEHHIDKSVLSDNPKMAIPLEPVSVTHFSMLPDKVSGQLGAWFFGKVRCVNGINDFYVTPTNGIDCEYKKDAARGGIYTVEGLTAEMNAYFAKNGVKYSSSFSYLELAAVRITYNEETGYYRAAVLKTIIVEANEQPESVCYLLDIGHKMAVTLNMIHPLPKAFCTIPPLAYRCYLFGVSQLQPNVSGKAEEVFTQAVERREALFRIRRVPEFDEASDFGYTEAIPYDVDVFVWDSSSDKFTKVANEITRNLYALAWKIGPGDELDAMGHFLSCHGEGKAECTGCYFENPSEFTRSRYSGPSSSIENKNDVLRN